jgi:excisionase family DNA binding protein
VEKFLKVAELAQILQVKPTTIYTWVRQGRIPHTRIGRLVRFTLAQIEKFTNGNGGKSTPMTDTSSSGGEFQ